MKELVMSGVMKREIEARLTDSEQLISYRSMKDKYQERDYVEMTCVYFRRLAVEGSGRRCRVWREVGGKGGEGRGSVKGDGGGCEKGKGGDGREILLHGSPVCHTVVTGGEGSVGGD